jgi:tetratricopeptide (TPR) repeat protein
VDHFSGKAHNPCEDAKTLDDLRDDLNVVRTLIKMGRFEQAYEAYIGDLSSALIFNLEAYAEVLSLLRTYFPKGWDRIPETLDKRFSSVLANDAALMLRYTNQLREAQAVFSISLLTALEVVNWKEIANTLRNISLTHSQQNNPSRAERVLRLSLEVAVLRNDAQDLFMNHLFHFANLSRMGQWAEAKAIWLLIDPMGRSWTRQIYRPGMAEHICALFHFKQGTLQHEHLVVAERFASEGKNRQTVRDLHSLRGEWLMEQRKWALAAKSFTEAVRMAREIGTTESEAETQLALTKLHLGQLLDPRREAEQLSLARNPAHQELAELWLALGDREQAKKHALAAYKWAWADGEPYVRRYELNKATALLKELGTEIPKLPSYDPAKDEKFPWEDKVAAAIEKLRAEK